jgi:hypothetical protein
MPHHAALQSIAAIIPPIAGLPPSAGYSTNTRCAGLLLGFQHAAQCLFQRLSAEIKIAWIIMTLHAWP